MSESLAPNSLLARLDTQPRVRDFLARAVKSGRASHAYLFLGSPVNVDVSDVVERIAACATTAGVMRALDAVAQAEARVARNVTPQLAIEVMLFDIRKALKCP